MGAGSDDGRCGCKLDRVAERRGMRPALASLVTAWREGTSLRGFAESFNHQVLKAALEAESYVPLDGEVENLYRLLTDGDVSGGMRTQARNRLVDLGLDVEALRAEFVSYQTVNRHLKNCLNLDEVDRETPLSIDDGEDRLFALRNRTAAVTRQTVEQLVRAGSLDIGEFEVYTDLIVSCTDCGTQADVFELLTRRGCRCEAGP